VSTRATEATSALRDVGAAPASTIAEVVEFAASRDADGIFYRRDADGVSLTFGEIHEEAERTAHRLTGLGLAAGDRALVWLPNGPLWISLLFACARLGVTVITAGPRLRMADIPYMLEHSRARAIFYQPSFMGTDYEAMVEELLVLRAAGGLPALEHVVRCAAGEGPTGTVRYQQLEESPALPAAPGPDDQAIICYTGGTTGRPKGCVHDHRTTVSNCWIASGLTGFAAGERLVSAMPFAHVFGFHMGILQPMIRGAGLIDAEPFSADEVLDLVERHHGTVIYGVPAMGIDLVAAQKARPRDLSSLRVTLLAGAPVPPKLRKQTMDVLGCGLTVVYGATESPTLTQLLPSDPEPQIFESVGRATPGLELAIFEPGTSNPLAAGEVGEIGSRGYNHMLGYLDDPEATSAKYRGEWIIPGDFGRLDEQGFLQVTGRADDMFLCGGFNVYPREVENQLELIDGLREVVVLGVPDDRLGEVGLAFVVVDDPELTAEKILAWAKERMASYKRPRYVELIPDMPRTHVGKTARGELQAQARSLYPQLGWDRADE
jgi:acyl-CoA synthetase (AMP-forming)/AMP-acid ligase II